MLISDKLLEYDTVAILSDKRSKNACISRIVGRCGKFYHPISLRTGAFDLKKLIKAMGSQNYSSLCTFALLMDHD